MDPNQHAIIGWISILAAVVNAGATALSLSDGEYVWVAIQGFLVFSTACFAYVNLLAADEKPR